MSNQIAITIKGNVGSSPILNLPEGKKPWTRVTVASSRRYPTADGTWVDGDTQWFTVKVFGEFAQNVAESVRKGDAVVVHGYIVHEDWTTREGNQRRDAVIVATAFGLDLERATARASRTVRTAEGQHDTSGYTAVERDGSRVTDATDAGAEGLGTDPGEYGPQDGYSEPGGLGAAGTGDDPEFESDIEADRELAGAGMSIVERIGA